MLRPAATGLALAAVLAFGAAAAAAQEAAPKTAPRGNREGLELLARVHAAYRHVPAVATTGRIGPLHVRFSLLLHQGVINAEEFVGTGSGVTTLVARGSGPTYAREPGTRCWRRLRRKNPQSLSDIGTRFPDLPRMQVKAPRRVGPVWLLPVVAQGHTATMRISAKTLLLQSLSVPEHGQTVTEHDQALGTRPKLPTPTPNC